MSKNKGFSDTSANRYSLALYELASESNSLPKIEENSHALLKLILNWSSSKQRANKLIQSHTLPLFDNIGKILVIGGSIYFVLLSWNINVTAIIASAGIIAAAIGFAAKDTLANLFAGIFIMADAPYKLGDYVNLDSGEVVVQSDIIDFVLIKKTIEDLGFKVVND